MKPQLTGKALVAAGHLLAKQIGPNTPLKDISALISSLATHLDVALARGDLLQKQVDIIANAEYEQRLANAEHQLYMAELRSRNLRTSRMAQFRKRKAVEAECDAIHQQFNQLAAENAKFLTLINDVIDNYEECEHNGYSSAVVDLDAISAIHTYLDRDVDGDNPFKETDAFLLNAQADGVDKLGQHYNFSSPMLLQVTAREFAKKLRAQAEELQKGGA
ncbi:hypothetical protein [Candidatus Pantoea multigeneris]|uniref:Uncharacterized protein n=1 Tax=Candidatus Pantoea multigeneris TaxID=2608357 RepID=A0ABX0R676_9GAMM|nr:hypothetical protein [Pantoea multigeneris]NIF20607.1 hypothetical protein [Pantoea multigeneris]